jgi:integrase/recombinase XerD
MACIRKLPSGNWQVDFRVRYVRKRQSFNTKKEAEIFLREIKLNMSGLNYKENLHDKKLSEAINVYKQTVTSTKSKETQVLEQGFFNEFQGYLKDIYISEIEPSMMESYQSCLAKRLMPSTVNRNFTLIRHFFNKCVDWEWIDKNPCLRVKSLKDTNQKAIKVFTASEVENILKQAHPWLADVILFLFRTGLRRKELCFLRWASIDLLGGMFHVESSEGFHTKSYKPRTIPITDEILALLQRKQRAATRNGKAKKTDFVFTNASGGFISPDHLTRSFKRLGKSIGVDELGPHKLRHSFCTNLVNSNVSLEKVRKLAGHADIEITQRYLHVKIDELKISLEDHNQNNPIYLVQ